MFDYRLHVFYKVAKRLNFTRAAEELFITQPAVTKHIRELEAQFKTALIVRSGNRKVSLTPAGITLLKYAEQLNGVYKELEFDMNTLANQQRGELKIGASNTVGQYVLPAILAKFHSRFKDVNVSLITGNTEQVEEALLNKEIDMGIIEGINRNPELSYQEFLKDEMVLVTATSNTTIRKDVIKPDELKNFPLLMREQGSGSQDVVMQALKQHSIKLSDLQVEMKLGNTESIKSYLTESNCLAFLSVHAVLKELKANELKIIDIKGVSLKRSFYLINTYGQPDQLAELFVRFAAKLQQ
ncbi:LysR family transcriptional regulator [Mucilaginibacter terrenus]|uniref:LysR family transcriptional regulator n=1 Tax=Mucilaginibacter terrenus TaxID=2482727 RepID=A0A3E2NT72_9SPHI|nr:LysR family transcriptional regulator [Mucilaginibacter terrenus]RFZ84206.1 LysR family transcriptional regulator [Mucilaginibacter terrenus]